MGYWGIAYASGAFYNKPWAWYGDDERLLAIKTCYHNVQQALALSSASAIFEQQLISALCEKYQADQTDNLAELEQWESDYSKSMCALIDSFP